MLTRRHLRIKVFQALYALESARDADYRLADDFITDSFQPDLNSMTPQNPQKLEGLRKTASLILQESYNLGKITDEDAPTEAFVTAKNALAMYQKFYKEDQQRIARRLVPEVEGVYDIYIKILLLVAELTKVSTLDRERVYDDPDFPIAREAALDTNTIFKAVVTGTTLETEVIRRGIHWEQNHVRKVYREVFKTDETYKTYCAERKHSPEEDQELAQYVIKQILFKHEELVSNFEQADLFWEENGDLVRKMLVKTFKIIGEKGGLELVPLTDEWEEDQFFMQELFKLNIENTHEYEEIISVPLKNWELDRLALTDNLILKMGVAEMMNFPSIPLKVSINEYIEVAKEYSTPKSGKFVNGMLDTLSKQLQKEGKIKKSGRGLMDNK